MPDNRCMQNDGPPRDVHIRVPEPVTIWLHGKNELGMQMELRLLIS